MAVFLLRKSRRIRIGDSFTHRRSGIVYMLRRIESSNWIMLMDMETGVPWDLPVKVADTQDIQETEAEDLFSGYFNVEFRRS